MKKKLTDSAEIAILILAAFNIIFYNICAFANVSETVQYVFKIIFGVFALFILILLILDIITKKSTKKKVNLTFSDITFDGDYVSKIVWNGKILFDEKISPEDLASSIVYIEMNYGKRLVYEYTIKVIDKDKTELYIKGE